MESTPSGPCIPRRGARTPAGVRGTMSATGPPAGWREDVVTMLFDFLEDAGLAHALRALETETGCARANETGAV